MSVAFGKLNKASKSLLTDDYSTGCKHTWKATSGNAKFKFAMEHAKGSSGGSFDVTLNKLVFGSSVSWSFNMGDQNLKTTVTSDGPIDVKGLSWKSECDPTKKVANLQALYSRSNLSSNFTLDLWERKGVTLSGAYDVSQVDGLTVGASLGAAQQKTEESSSFGVDEFDLGFKWSSSPIDLSYYLKKKFSKGQLGLWGKATDSLNIGFQLNHTVPKKNAEGEKAPVEIDYEFGWKYKVDDKSTLKAKVNKSGHVSAVISSKLSDNVAITLSATHLADAGTGMCCGHGSKASDTAKPTFGFGLTVE